MQLIASSTGIFVDNDSTSYDTSCKDEIEDKIFGKVTYNVSNYFIDFFINEIIAYVT